MLKLDKEVEKSILATMKQCTYAMPEYCAVSASMLSIDDECRINEFKEILRNYSVVEEAEKKKEQEAEEEVWKQVE